jgi:hypothetical protein
MSDNPAVAATVSEKTNDELEKMNCAADLCRKQRQQHYEHKTNMVMLVWSLYFIIPTVLLTSLWLMFSHKMQCGWVLAIFCTLLFIAACVSVAALAYLSRDD